jgi:hypothetical protein
MGGGTSSNVFEPWPGISGNKAQYSAGGTRREQEKKAKRSRKEVQQRLKPLVHPQVLVINMAIRTVALSVALFLGSNNVGRVEAFAPTVNKPSVGLRTFPGRRVPLYYLNSSPFQGLLQDRRRYHQGAVSHVSSSSLTLRMITGGEIMDGWNSFLTAVEVFDGSTIVDPVVVSNAFWASLTRQFVSLLIGQLFAAVVFGLLTTFAASQMSSLGNFVSEKVFGATKSTAVGSGLKQPPPGYTGDQPYVH